ncbi:MAG: DUF5723 family protein [Gemmatimonadota bacterium]|nr:DUF5723 family protein [Gemmatimonadota bacterium]
MTHSSMQVRALRCRIAALAVAAAALVALPAVAAAQGNASSAAAGMGGNYTALARNFNAVAWNPANLGLDGNSSFSIALSPQFGVGTGPITLKDIKDYEGVLVPDAIKQAWLQKVIDNNGQSVGGNVDVNFLALSIGPMAFSASSTINTDGQVPAAVAELILFGNAGRTGTAQDFTATDLALDANATSTFAAAYGRRLGIMPMGEFAVGATVKYIIGHGMASLRDNGSTITSNPIQVDLDAPVVLTDTASNGFRNNGSGLGLDVGATWTLGNLRLAGVVKNVVNTFAWKTDQLYYMPIKATFTQDSSSSQVDTILPLSAAPAALRAELEGRIKATTPQPTLVLGGAYTGFSRLTLAADLRTRFGEGIDLGPQTQFGVGAELRIIPFVPLRAGVTALSAGMRYSGGIGLEFGVVNLQASAALLTADGRNDTTAGFTLSFGGR